MNFKFDNKNNTILLSLNENIYSLDAILGACYVFIDKAYIYLDKNKDKILISFKLKNKSNKRQLENIVSEFQNELLNQTLRIKIAKSNKKIREYIISQALFSALPPEQPSIKEKELDKELEEILKEVETETEDYKEDPLGIAVPWEEKYGKEK